MRWPWRFRSWNTRPTRARNARQRDAPAARLARQSVGGELELEGLDRQRIATETAPPEVVRLANYPTPLSRTVDGPELQFQLRGGRLVMIPMEQLATKFHDIARHQIDKLEHRSEFTDTVGPIDGFCLRYTIVRHDFTPEEVREHQSLGFSGQVKKFTLIPVSENLGETVEEALRENSQLRRVLAEHAAEHPTITIWTYPDGFAAFRRIKEELYRLGFATAGRPLPQDVPIGVSPQGTKSAAEWGKGIGDWELEIGNWKKPRDCVAGAIPAFHARRLRPAGTEAADNVVGSILSLRTQPAGVGCWKAIYNIVAAIRLHRDGDAVDLLQGNRQRRHDHQHVAQGTEQNALAAGKIADAHAAALFPRIRLLRRAVADQLDAGHQPALADVADLRQRGDPPQMPGQPVDLRRQPGERLLLLEDVERGQAPPPPPADCPRRCDRGRRSGSGHIRPGTPARSRRSPAWRPGASSRRSAPWPGRADRA